MYTCTHTEFGRGIKSQPSNQKLLKARGLDVSWYISHIHQQSQRRQVRETSAENLLDGFQSDFTLKLSKCANSGTKKSFSEGLPNIGQ